jgi:glutaminase
VDQQVGRSLRVDEPRGYATSSPLELFLTQCHDDVRQDGSGALANYIPELARANPDHFGVALTTLDGHTYEVGDSRALFTIQSVSKAFVFALAMEILGDARVEAAIGVEPSGEAFNSIRLTADNRPFNPMVNAGAIACSGLIHRVEGAGAFERIRQALSRYAGRDLDVDESVYASESATGDRNRAIAWLLRNYSVIEGDVNAVLDVYFRQCAILVTARDLAVMGATLANHGVNPVTGVVVASPHVVARTLSVMTSSGMYDYAGEWVYRVGIPAKSGVGGGIVAALPAQIGMGTFSPLLDSHGNSVRGLKVCEALSSHFDLHMLNRSADVRTSVIADYETARFATRRNRAPHERKIIEERHHDVRVLELVGALSFATIDYVTRQLAAKPPAASLLILDCRRVPAITEAGARLLGEHFGRLAAAGTTVIVAGVDKASGVFEAICSFVAVAQLRRFDSLDEAIEWAEDQIVYRYGGFSGRPEAVGLADQPLLAGLSKKEIASLTARSVERSYEAGARIVASGEPARSVFFLESGNVSVKMPSGVRLASFAPGVSFGEMAMIEPHRSADVFADTGVKCLELPLAALGEEGARVTTQILRNLASLLARRLILANAKVDLLSGFSD